MVGKNKAFAHFGASGRNPVWSWSARSADGQTVVMTVWSDHIDYSTHPPRYRSTVVASGHSKWLERPGNRERLENLIWAEDHCGGQFRVVITEAVDPAAEPRKIKANGCHPQDHMVGRIRSLNRKTGEFEADLLCRS